MPIYAQEINAVTRCLISLSEAFPQKSRRIALKATEERKIYKYVFISKRHS
jgi:hypothetical protein